MARQTPPTVLRTLATFTSGHTLAVYVPSHGSFAGQQRTGLLTPHGRPCKSMPADTRRMSKAEVAASRPAGWDVVEPTPVAVVAVEVTPQPAPVQPEPAAEPAPATQASMPSPHKGEKWSAFAGRCRSAGFDFAAASVAWKACKPASKPASASQPAPEAKPVPTPSLPESVDAPSEIVETRSQRRRDRKAAMDAQVTSVVDEQRKNAERLADLDAKLDALIAALK